MDAVQLPVASVLLVAVIMLVYSNVHDLKDRGKTLVTLTECSYMITILIFSSSRMYGLFSFF